MFGIRAELSRSQLKRKGEGKSTRNQDYVFEFKMNSKPCPSVQFYWLAFEIKAGAGISEFIYFLGNCAPMGSPGDGKSQDRTKHSNRPTRRTNYLDVDSKRG
jgi:hypothetical protein